MKSLTHSRFLHSFLAVMGGLGLASLHAAAADEAGATTGRAVDEVLAQAYAPPADQRATPLAERVRPVLDRYLDFATLTRRSIGPGWPQFTPDEQQRALTAFSTLVVQTYAARFGGNDRPRISYEPSTELAADRREVRTRVSYAGSTYQVTYRLEQLSGGWRIYDIVIEGVSLVANYREQFEALFQKGGASAVLHALETKTAQPQKA